MNYYIKSTKVCFSDQIKPAIIHIENGNFKDILDYNHNIDAIDYGDNFIMPGLFDSHTHGYAGYSFTSTSTVDDILEVLKLYASMGVTSILASSSVTGYRSIIEATKRKGAAKILGIHAEGPFLNDKRYGIAKPGTKFLRPDIEIVKELIKSSNDLIKVMTIAPEVIGAIDVIKYLKENNIKVAIGHTDATYQQFKEFVSYLDIATHVGNTMTGMHHRDIGVLGGLMLSNIPVELITDGIHISHDMMAIMFKLKSIEDFIFVSDFTPLSGLSVGEYQLDYTKVKINKEGQVINEFGHLTGSSKGQLEGIKSIYSLFDFPLYKVINAATLNPAKLYDFDDEIGSISQGKKADYIIVDNDFNLQFTFLEGECVFEYKNEIIKENPKLKEVMTRKEFLSFYK